VAEKAGITKTLYYHFRSKDEFIAAYLQAKGPADTEAWLTDALIKDGTVTPRPSPAGSSSCWMAPQP
jgi:AcrR family transcriptional regulator